MITRDSLGVPLEPTENTPVLTDWKGNEVYTGDVYYMIEGDIVLKDDVYDYLDETLGGINEA